MRRLGLLGVLLAVTLGAVALPASAFDPEPPCEIPPELAGQPSVEWCEEELRGWERERSEDARREAREEQKARAEERETARLQREWAHKPTVALRIAQIMSARTVRNAGYPNGWVQCRGGRVDRTHWNCKVRLFVHCLRSRMRIWGAGYRNGQPLYGTRSGRFRECRV